MSVLLVFCAWKHFSQKGREIKTQLTYVLVSAEVSCSTLYKYHRKGISIRCHELCLQLLGPLWWRNHKPFLLPFVCRSCVGCNVLGDCPSAFHQLLIQSFKVSWSPSTLCCDGDCQQSTVLIWGVFESINGKFRCTETRESTAISVHLGL